MTLPYYRLSDADLLIWSSDFSGKLSHNPTYYDVTAGQATEYAALNTAFENALGVWRNNSTRTPVASANKKAAREALLDMARFLVNAIDSNPATTNAQRDELGIRIRKKPSHIPAPDTSPIIDIVRVDGRRVTIGIHSSEGSKRGKPAGVQGASVFWFLGNQAPTDPNMWNFEGLITRTKFELNFDQHDESNTVWVSVKWYNERGQTGIASAPVSINLPAPIQLPRGRAIKIAA